MNKPAKILVVDDQPVVLRATCRFLESAGYISLSAQTGAEGLRLAAEQKPDLVLVNASLPDISGFEVCTQIKKNAHLRGIYVVILSARNPGSSSQSEESQTGADGYIREGLVDPTDPRLAAALEERQRTGRFRGELTFLRSDGQLFPGEITSTLFQEAGEVRTSKIIRDETERWPTE